MEDEDDGEENESEVMLSDELSAHEGQRQRAKPERLQMVEFYRRELPAVATEKGTQRARAQLLQQSRGEEMDAARREGFDAGKLHAEEMMQGIKKRMDDMWKNLVETREKFKREHQEHAAFRRKVSNEKRQRTLEHFFRAPLPHDTRHRGEPESLGEGYTDRNISSGLFSQHVKAIEMQIISTAKDDPLKQLQLAAAVSQRMQGIRHLRERDQEAWSYVRNSLKAFFETLQDSYAGRYPNHIRAAQQAVCAAIANAVPPRKLHVVSEELGISVDRLSEGRKHWSQWMSGDRNSLMDLRGKIRDDEMKEEWIEFAVDTWKTLTRRSERAKDSLRNPNDKSDTRLYRIHWLEVRIRDIHDFIVREGKRKFDKPAIPATEASPAEQAVEFHFSWWYTIKVRPFFVKDGGREVCVCVYHLRFDLFVEALYNYTKRLRHDTKTCNCQHPNHKSAIDFRRAHVCVREELQGRYDAVACVTNECSRCKDLKMFNVCDCTPLPELPKIKCQLYEKFNYECKDGQIKEKKDFRPKEVSYQDFDTLFRKYWPKFMLHHDVGKWQDDECRYLKSHLSRGETFEIEDFGENYHIERKREHQSYYFSEVGVTLHGCMLRINLADLSDDYVGGPAERAKLMALFAAEDKPPVVLIAHIVVSEDLTHDNAFVQHVNSNIIWPWLKRVIAPDVVIRRRTLCTDGAPSQYKLADQILWLSKQGEHIEDFLATRGSARMDKEQQPTPFVRHVFRGTAHGKDDSDPEIGHHKNAADRWQLSAGESEVARLFSPLDFYNFVCAQMRTLQKDIYCRKGVGIFRREFHWIPNKGVSSVNRRIAGCNRLGDVGIKKLHFFNGIGRPGFVGIRERSCHTCPGACADNKFELCKNTARCGQYRILQLNPKTAISRTSTRRHRENGALAFAESCKEGDFFAIDHTIDSTEKFTLLSVAKDNLLRTAEEPIAQDAIGHLAVSVGDDVIDGVRYSCVSPGGTVFTATGLEVTVPVTAIFAFDLDVEELDTSRRTFRSHIHRKKWQLSSDDHGRMLRLLTENLDDVVRAAVQTVSGRS